MRTIYDPNLKATIMLDDSGQVRGIKHLDKYREVEHLRGREAATAYVRSIAENSTSPRKRFAASISPCPESSSQPQDVEYRFSEEKASFDSATYAYYQTWLNTPVWAAALPSLSKQPPRASSQRLTPANMAWMQRCLRLKP